MPDPGVVYDDATILYDDPNVLYAPGDFVAPPTGETAATFAEALLLDPLQIPGAPIIDPWGIDENGDPCLGYIFCEAFNRAGTGEPAYWNAVYWNAFYWSGSSPGAWVDIAPFVRGWSWKRGANSPLDNPAIGTASIELDNTRGQFSAWTDEAFSFTAKVGTLIRFGAYFNNVPKFFFTGLVRNSTSVDNFLGTTTLELNELGAWLSAHNGLEQPTDGAHESLDARMSRLLTECGWPGGFDVDNDAIGDAFDPPVGTNLSANRWTEVLKTADSVGMVVQVGANGKLRVRPEYPPYAVTPTIRNYSNRPGPGVLPIVGATMYASNERLVNVAIAASADSTEQEVTNLGSIDKYGRADGGAGSRDDLLGSDANTLAVLQQVVNYHHEDVFGVETVLLDMFQSESLACALADIADSSLTDRLPFALSYEHPSGQVFEATMVIDGLTMSMEAIGPDEGTSWTAQLSVAAIPIALAHAATFDVSYFDNDVFAFDE